MAFADTEMEPLSHPWLAEFAKAPAEAFGDLLAGYAEVFPYDRADAPDAAHMLFGGLPANAPLRQTLDEAVLTWLEQRRRAPLSADLSKLQRAVREINEALEIVALLRLPKTAIDLRVRYAVWNEWVAPLTLSPARDARAEFWRAIALTQPLVAEADPATNPLGLEPLWHHLCREAGGDLPERYLDIGLLGLRRLPDQAGQVPWLAGLAQWALSRDPSDDAFKAEWMALKALHPRTGGQWRKLVKELLSAPNFSDQDIEFPAWWRVDRDFDLKREAVNVNPIKPLLSPLPRDCHAVIDELGKPFARVESKIDALMQRHRFFVNRTGDSRYMVRAIHVLAAALIAPRGDDTSARARKAQALAREGLDWEPRNQYLWSVWRDAYAAEGLIEAAELVGWEELRALPSNVQGYVQLAVLLGQQPGRTAEAEALLRAAVERFQDNPHSRNTLAELLIAEERLPEAMEVVEAAISEGMAVVVTYAIQARLLSHGGRNDLAREAVERGFELEDNNEVLRGFKAKLDKGHSLTLQSALFHSRAGAVHVETEAAVVDPAVEPLLQRGRLRRLRFRLESPDESRRAEAVSELQEIFESDPAFAYAKLLAARQGIWRAESDVLPHFAASFEQALRTEDRAKLEGLGEWMPHLEKLTLVARATLGDEQAAAELEVWLHGPLGQRSEPAVQTIHRELQPILMLIQTGVSAADAVAARHTIVLTVLHDANELALAA